MGHRLPLLLARKPNLDLENDYHDVPLHWAIFHNNEQCVRMLLQHGANIEIWTQLHHSPLLQTIGQRKLELMKLLIDQGANVHSAPGRTSAMHHAANQGCSAAILILLDNPEACQDLNQHDEDKKTPLHLIAAFLAETTDAISEVLHATKAMIAAGADPNVKNGNRSTALHIAAKAGKVETARLLLESGVDAAAQNLAGKTAMDLAVGKRHKSMIELLRGWKKVSK